jgi:hypothetical protein
LEIPDQRITGCFIFIRNYFTPLPIRQDVTAFEGKRTHFFHPDVDFFEPRVPPLNQIKKGWLHERASHHIDLAFCVFVGRMCMGRFGTGPDSQFTLVYQKTDQSRDR